MVAEPWRSPSDSGRDGECIYADRPREMRVACGWRRVETPSLVGGPSLTVAGRLCSAHSPL